MDVVHRCRSGLDHVPRELTYIAFLSLRAHACVACAGSCSAVVTAIVNGSGRPDACIGAWILHYIFPGHGGNVSKLERSKFYHAKMYDPETHDSKLWNNQGQWIPAAIEASGFQRMRYIASEIRMCDAISMGCQCESFSARHRCV